VAVAEVNGLDHVAGHEGITLECPLTCLGLRTVADLLRLLADTGRATGLQPRHPSVLDRVPHEHERVTLDCPITCLRLPPHVLNPLRGQGQARTVGDVLRLLEREGLGDIRGIGRSRIRRIREAFIAAGFSASRYPSLRS
jgi:hypothetical protein